MNSKHRVIAALNRQPVDRVPVFMWFHPSTARRLATMLEIPPNRVGEAMGNDIWQAWVNNNHAMEGIVHEHDGQSHVDDWGITWTKEGEYNQVTHYPLANRDRDAVLAYEFPNAAQEALLANMLPIMERADRYYVGVDVSPCAYEMYWRLRGMEDALLDLAADPELADTMLGRCADFAVEVSVKACDRFAVDWLWTGDDVAGQHSMIMSPDCWRGLIKPHLKRVVDIGTLRGLPVAYHSCGAIRPIIPDLIEIGIGILNPVQCTCPGMDPLELKREFGSRLAFMGGVDTQYLLPNGTAAEVRRATARLLEVMTSDGGGYILAASHTVPPETPDDNLFAMYEEVGITREEVYDRAAEIRKRGVGQE